MIQEIWIYPVKACGGVSVRRAQLTSVGLEFDRTWCIVDCDGVNLSKMEAISQRKVPMLCTVAVTFSNDNSMLLLDAPGMPQLAMPTALEEYLQWDTVQVESSGKSTTTGVGWSLGFQDARVHPAASSWISEYLNREVAPGGRLVSGFKVPSRYAVARSVASLDMESYPPIFPLVARAANDPRFAGNAKQFADFAPLHLVNEASARFVSEQSGESEPYPIRLFRANLVVGGPSAWAEESWAKIEVHPGEHSDDHAPVLLRKVKEVARCNVPCRDQVTGGWLFPDDTLRLWKVLRKAFPRKDSDPDWGSWAGPFFGVYLGAAGREGMLHVGDVVRVTETCRWDDHLRWRMPRDWAVGLGVATAVIIVAGATWARARAR
mmetsp:Transcript_38223/g.109159  ORF Transcript_38223/g.109159 Transcript_38223/m.109159 type:complete len:377 (-) Transcript_38223:193-1323(-)|eukprot:CAMPEP_0168403682 /NCGR_PEP_ID=MMETSP0228-20121227/24251_1 /TAXON_ID=133427 /ORGANISM="Protoceratium reticulatum, Strain CCCM 535 (=CCMP 1889)" /LENGTH=376 /DNA_ID=CAMNT_0008417285 /DNA_START=57 /DNA_END=1187 /DNA_ORIENTATION=-